MKKLLALVVIAFVFAGLAWAAESPLYAKSLPIQKITSHEKGYKVTYFTAHGDLKTIYVPLEWFYQIGDFRTADGYVKAEIVRGTGPAYPYIQFFWKDGKFHHLRLFVVNDYQNRTWGVVNPAENLGSKFDPAKDLDLQF